MQSNSLEITILKILNQKIKLLGIQRRSSEDTPTFISFKVNQNQDKQRSLHSLLYSGKVYPTFYRDDRFISDLFKPKHLDILK